MNAPATVATARPAATLILLRDAAQGPEVLMLKRHGLSDVLGGAFVFPGGKLDAADAQLDEAGRLDTPAKALHERLGEPEIDLATAASLYVAALREAFEECGLLLAEGADGVPAEEIRARHLAGMPFNELLAQFGLRLGVGGLAPWSRWITPSHVPKRFDTRFFVARAPAGVARHDDHETTEVVWRRPRAALEDYWRGGMPLAPPQIMTLAALSLHPSVDSALAAARARLPALVQPHVIGEGETRTLCYPGDQAHPVRARAMPGPLRLVVRDKRYEPVDGFEAFFA